MVIVLAVGFALLSTWMMTTVDPLANSTSPLPVTNALSPIPVTSWNPGTPPIAAVRVPSNDVFAVLLSGYRVAMMVRVPVAVVYAHCPAAELGVPASAPRAVEAS